MHNPRASLALALPMLVVLAGASCAHGAPDVGSWNGMNESTAVTTSIHDAPPEEHWLQEYTPEVPPPQVITTLDGRLLPGYYTLTLQSYCLHAGTYSPTAGDGYLIAPLTGAKADEISQILKRSADHLEVPQHDIQRLIWGIEAGAGFDEYDPAFILRIKPVLGDKELAGLAMNTGLRHGFGMLQGMLPSPLRDAASFYGELRSTVTSATATFEQVERLAVLTGVAPPGPGSRDVPSGAWSYIGDGVYMRVFPQGYPTTTVEIVRPARYALVRDGKGRIISFQSGPFRVDTTYEDRPYLVRSSGAAPRPIWLLKSIRLRGPGAGDEATLQGAGWVIPAEQPGRPLDSGRPPPGVAPSRIPAFAEVQDVYGRAEHVASVVRLVSDANHGANKQALADAFDLDHYMRGLIAARASPVHPVRLKNAWAYAVCVLEGNCQYPGVDGGGPDQILDVDLTKHVAVPGNTGKQRLGMSWRRH
jgi:hypothetical protein